jgi:molybdopterin molybdotransferase
MRHLKTGISVKNAIAHYARIEPVEPKVIPLANAIGLRIVGDVLVKRSVPGIEQAGINGFAVSADDLVDATRRKPVALKHPASPIDKAAPLPDGCDAVLAFKDIVQTGDTARATTPVKAGDGVRKPDGLFREGEVLFGAGQIITMTAAMAGAFCNVNEVLVRQPVVDIIFNAQGITRSNDRLVDIVSAAIRGSGSRIGSINFASGDPVALADMLLSSAADIIGIIGGTGDGPGDTTVEAMAAAGEVMFHGIRLSPGSSMAFGMVGKRAVFASPASLPDIAAVNILMTPAFSRRAFGRPARELPFARARLNAAVPAARDMTLIIFARVSDGQITPLGGADIRFADMARANAVIVLEEGSRHKRVGEFVPYLRLGAVM